MAPDLRFASATRLSFKSPIIPSAIKLAAFMIGLMLFAFLSAPSVTADDALKPGSAAAAKTAESANSSETATIAGNALSEKPSEAAEADAGQSGDPINNLAKLLENPDSEIVSLPPGDVDLAGQRINVGKAGVKLAGAPGIDFAGAIAAEAESFLKAAATGGLSAQEAQTRLGPLVQTLLDGLPKTRIHNSQARAVTSAEASSGFHSGLSAPKGGFSLINLAFSGTNVKAVRADAATGASHLYMGLVGPDLNRLAKEDGDYPGLGDVMNVAFVGNSVDADSNVNVGGNTIFFTQRRYGHDGSFDAKNPNNALSPLNSIVGSLFHNNVVMVETPVAEGDTGNRPYSGAGVGWAKIGLVDASLFASNKTSGGHHSFGGALFAARIDKLERSIFLNNSNAADHDAFGGAVQANIGLLASSIFIGNSTRGIANDHVPGTAVAGGAVNGSVETVSGSFLGWNLAESDVPNEAEEKEATGGALNTNSTALIENSLFVGNSVQVSAQDGLAQGGAVHINATTDDSNPRSPKLNETKILNTRFSDNSAVAKKGLAQGGAVSVAIAGQGAYKLVIAAEKGSETIFSGNKTSSLSGNGLDPANQDNKPENRSNGLSITGGAAGGATLAFTAEEGSKVVMADPLAVNLQEGGDFTLARDGEGELQWGGANIISVAKDAKTAIDFGNEGEITLLEDFQLSPGPNSPNLKVALSGADIHLKISDPSKPFFRKVDFTDFKGSITAELLEKGETSAQVVLASECAGVKAQTTAWTDPETGETTTFALEPSGLATVTREEKKL